MFPIQDKMPGKNGGDVETFFGPSVKIEGKFFSQGNVVIEGMVSGTLKTENNLHIGKNAKIAAIIEARGASIAGEVRGNIKAKERLDLAATAKVIGDIEAKTVSIAEGAVLQGKCTMVGFHEEGSSDKPQALNVKPPVNIKR